MNQTKVIPLREAKAELPASVDNEAGSPGRSERTRLALMKAAESLFGDFGIDAVGLRTISDAAQQKNNNAVQYHFGGKLELLNAILEYREMQLQPLRQALLDQGAAQDRLKDIRWLLRVMFEPSFRLYRDQQDINYLKLHAAYITTHRPRGVPHPVDTDSPSCVAFREAIRLMGERLAFLGERRLWWRLESVGEMFLSTFIQHSVRKQELNPQLDELFEDSIEMMAAAISAIPMR
ncbi:TetR family transcriptional regulator [Nevskia sp.]|uniref:TetR/AcrR family transcriptional regulator n=1 Tax=Nevskia sp. TaxID=1929292 RepID=UPI0025DD6A85|nr:TetR family transcriptional regulator [Nevskia sp.]